MSDRLWIVLPCGGRGTRFGSAVVGSAAAGNIAAIKQSVAKQYALIGMRTVLALVIERMLTLNPERIVLVVAEGDGLWQACVPPRSRERIVSTAGGAHRAASVLNGLQALDGHAAPMDWVMVHDVVRPCVTREDCLRLLAAVADDATGGLLAIPVADTIKAADSDARGSFAIRTVPREGLWYAQTPQVFRYGVLRDAMLAAAASGDAITDEASALERVGRRPRIVHGNTDNLKITWPEDLARAAMILAAQASND